MCSMRSRFASICHHGPISEPCASLVCPVRFILPFFRRSSGERLPVSRYSSGTRRAGMFHVEGINQLTCRRMEGKKRENRETPGGFHLTTSGASERAHFRIRFGCRRRSRARLLSAPDDDYMQLARSLDRPRAFPTTFSTESRRSHHLSDRCSYISHSAPRRVT